MVKRRIFVSLILCFVLVGFVVAPVFGALSTYYLYTTVSNPFIFHSYLDGAYGIDLTGTGGVYVSTVSFYLANLTAVSYGDVHVTILNGSLTGNGTRLENSSSYDVSALVSARWVTFVFANTTELQAGVTYYIALVSEGLNYDLAMYGSSVQDIIVSKHGLSDGWGLENVATTWACQVIVSDTYGSGTGTAPALPDSTSGSDTETTIASLMWWFIYLIVMLAPAWFLGGYLKMGKWGFLMGLAIGAGVGYAFLSGFPLWLLLLVAVGEVGMFYVDVQKG